jgi:uncharacterized membrane protein
VLSEKSYSSSHLLELGFRLIPCFVSGFSLICSSGLKLIEFYSGGFFIFATNAFPYLPFFSEMPWGISYYHKINAFVIVGGCLVIFALAMYTGKRHSSPTY